MFLQYNNRAIETSIVIEELIQLKVGSILKQIVRLTGY